MTINFFLSHISSYEVLVNVYSVQVYSVYNTHVYSPSGSTWLTRSVTILLSASTEPSDNKINKYIKQETSNIIIIIIVKLVKS